MVNLVLEYDDLHFLPPENCMETIDKLVERFPDIKLSFFSIPYLRGFPVYADPEFCDKLRDHISNGNVSLAVHGLHHNQEEFKMYSYDQAYAALHMAESIFEEAKLPYRKVFRGPHWGLCDDSVKAMVKRNYTHLYSHEDYLELGESYQGKIKVLYYNWNLADEAPLEEGLLNKLIAKIAPKTIIAHGHTHDTCSNGIAETFDKVCSYIENNDVNFKFVHEV